MRREHDGEGVCRGGGVSGTSPNLLLHTAQSCTVITANQGVRGGRLVELKQTVDEAVSSCPGVRNVLVSRRTENPLELRDKDVDMEEVRGQRGVPGGLGGD